MLAFISNIDKYSRIASEAWHSKSSLYLAIAIAWVTYFIITVRKGRKTADFPLINPARGFELFDRGRRKHFVANAQRIIKDGCKQYPNQCFNVMTDMGVTTIIPNDMVDAIRNNPNLSFTGAVAEDMHAHIPGFEPFASGTRTDELLQAVVQYHLTQHLSKMVKPLSDETSYAVDLRFGTSTDWKTVAPHPDIVNIIARVSSRAFLGLDVCRNEEWLDLSSSYALKSFLAGASLRQWSPWMRNIVHHFHPQCKQIRDQRTRAMEIIQPVLEKRQQERSLAQARGEEVPRFDDAIDWAEEEAKGHEYDPAALQMTLSLAAVHTTTTLMLKTLLQLAKMPELVSELRQEMAEVISVHGWSKQSLVSLRLLDGTLKEMLRMQPGSIVHLTRLATADVVLPTGDVLPKGSRSLCTGELKYSSSQFEDPGRFDPHRYLAWRGTDRDHLSHLVSTSPAMLGFGYGLHACPGRFFASNEIKIMLCHILMKYDWKIAPETQSTEPLAQGLRLVANMFAKVEFRRRDKPEIDLDAIE
ncbi:ent-kaurene oxidase [Fusarium austroafricanum]|uniref:Ent-kaurene oxidase n=1 Tax=Fusarium austroafricanum TaxID=2364996 RepID=A0A8H4KG09_9HYPO|nr:ent-kaurene oxidase [Fusarium austroafricanum]